MLQSTRDNSNTCYPVNKFYSMIILI